MAAAASRIGKTVLHIDANSYYGAQWASFNLENIQSLADINDKSTSVVSNVKYAWTPQQIIPNVENINLNDTEISTDTVTKVDENAINIWTKEKILSEFRKFNIDLTPKVSSVK